MTARPVTTAHLLEHLVLPPLASIVLGYVSAPEVDRLPMPYAAPWSIKRRPVDPEMWMAYMGDVEPMMALLDKAAFNTPWNSCVIGAIAAGHVALLDWLWTYRDSHTWTHRYKENNTPTWKCADDNEVCTYCYRINSDDVQLAAVSNVNSLAWILQHKGSKYATPNAFTLTSLYSTCLIACDSGRIDSFRLLLAEEPELCKYANDFVWRVPLTDYYAVSAALIDAGVEF